MKQNGNQHIMDITFVGAGIATTFTLLPLLESLKNDNYKDSSLQICIVEKDDEWFTGLAYGPRSGESALLITSLSDFLPEGEIRLEFISWLKQNKEALVEDLRSDGGSLSLNWIRTHKDEIQAGEWEDIYIPRRFFGKFLKEKMNGIIHGLEDNKAIELIFIKDEVKAIEKLESGYSIQFNSERRALNSNKVVLSIGIPPSKTYWNPEDEIRYRDSICLVSDPYSPGLRDSLDKIGSFVSERDSNNVVIIGANASAMEMIYKLNDQPEIRAQLDDFFIVSPQGELPNSAQDDFTRMVRFVPENLVALEDREDLTAWEIYKAANLDLDVAEERGYGTAISEVPISKAFISLLGKLNQEELTAFAGHYGNEIGKRQRRAGKHYTDVVDHLKAQNRIRNVKGYFTGLFEDEDTGSLRFKFRPESGKLEEVYGEDIGIVISCTGAKTLDNSQLPILHNQLIEDKLCMVNQSKRGFLVDDKMQASPGLFIAGPLLAGNVIGNIPFWHLEHCGRIISLGEQLAQNLLDRETTLVMPSKV